VRRRGTWCSRAWGLMATSAQPAAVRIGLPWEHRLFPQNPSCLGGLGTPSACASAPPRARRELGAAAGVAGDNQYETGALADY
jgi:hypothetical protein